jgi:CHASE1-domain containing sensor protein
MNERYVRSQFGNECDVLEQRLNFWMEPNGSVLYNLQGMFHNVVQIVRDIFELYVSIPESSHPGVQAIGYAPKISRKDIGAFVLYAQNEGYIHYRLSPPGDRPTYFPAQYVVPIVNNRKTSGFDLYSDPNLRSAIDLATDSNKITTTSMVSLGLDRDSTVFLFVPIYADTVQSHTMEERRKFLKGVCFIELHVKTFIEHALHFNYDSSRISFCVFDGLDTNARVIFGTPDHSPHSRTYVKQMQVFNRVWTIVFIEKPYLASFYKNLIISDVVLYLGLSVGIVLFLIISFFIFKLEKLKDQPKAKSS